MGQYWQVVFLSEDGKTIIFAIHPHDFCSGAKFGEHTWIYSSIMNTVEALLSPEGQFYKSRVVWAGDYAKPDDGQEQNLYNLASEKREEFGKMWDLKLKMPSSIAEYKYVVNHSKKLYIKINKHKIETDDLEFYEKQKHPLPNMVCDGEGRHGEWVGDIISIEKSKPESDFTEFIYRYKSDD